MLNLKNLNQQAINPNVSNRSLDIPCFQKDGLQGQKKFKSICDLFEDRVQISPNSIAVIFEGARLSYFNLNKKSNELACYLRSQGVKPGVVVGLSLSKNENLIIGIMGILKTGGTYLPLDPDYPEERLKYMMDDASPVLLLTQSELAHRLPTKPMCKTVLMDMDWGKIEATALVGSPNGDDIDPDFPAYIFYTSGSTGQPKGIVVAHRSLPNVVESRFDIYPKNPIALLVGSISFDPTLLTILYVLIAGGTLCVPVAESYSDLKKIVDLINEHSVNYILCVTSFYSMLLENAAMLPTLEYVFIGGEPLPSSLPSLHTRIAPGAYLFNEYGPAEHAIGGTISKIYDPKQKQLFPITIGKPLPNVQIHILDENLKPVLMNSEGEIFIGGIGLAKGYLNRQELTAQKFLWLSLQGQELIRLYRTGDWGRFLPNGDIEFLGRIDHQVKIWGHRIELAEIESVLSKYSSVNEVVVVVQEKESKRLIAFYSTNASQCIGEALRTHLSRFLPNYMIPSRFVQVDRWPKTPNGKIDRAGLLPLLETSVHRLNHPSFTPSQIEMGLLEIWKRVLQKEDFGLNDNFFDLGGDSVQVSYVQALIEDKFNLSMNIIELFQLPTLSQLATHLQTKAEQLSGKDVKYFSSSENPLGEA